MSKNMTDSYREFIFFFYSVLLSLFRYYYHRSRCVYTRPIFVMRKTLRARYPVSPHHSHRTDRKN